MDQIEALLQSAKGQRPMSAEYDYARDGAEIYRRSFAIIRSEADLARFTPDEARVAVRVIHACGMVEIARDLVFGPGFVAAARGALLQGSRSSATQRWWRTASPARGSLPATRSSARSILPASPTAPRASTPRALPQPSISGSTASAVRSSPSAMRRRPCSVCSS